MDFLGVTFLIFAPLGFIIYRFLFKNRNYFDKRGIKYEKPSILFGNLGQVLLKKVSGAENLDNFYKKYSTEKIFGFFSMLEPTYVVCDPELIKKVCVSDFNHFHDHGFFLNEDIDPILGNQLIALSGKKWKDMRTVISPVFTASKLKIMSNFISKCSLELCEYLETQNSEVDAKDTFSKVILNVISTCAFGIEVNSFKNPEHIFYQFGKKLTEFFSDTKMMIKSFGFFFFPKLMKLMKIQLLDPETSGYFKKLIKNSIEEREKHGSLRPDMLHLLLKAKYDQDSNEKWNDNDLTAQCVTFLGAGFETSATLLSFMAYELAINPEVQEKLFKEVSALEENLSQENLFELKYMDMVISETLRLWPPFTATDRKCTEDYTLKSADGSFSLNIEKDKTIWFPVYSIHRDSKFYENPDQFDPERFSDDNKHKIDPFTYLPFGAGNRNCVGMRFALMEAKIIMFHVLRSFHIEVSAKQQVPVKISPSSFLLAPDGGFLFNFKKRTN